MTVADYIFKKLLSKGLNTVFGVVGGYSMYLNDAVKRNKDIKFYSFHHENACANAADSFSRLTGKPAILLLTAGIGTLNALNGIASMYYSSLPCIILVGDTQRNLLLKNNPGLRESGDQESNVISAAKDLVKYSITVEDENKIDEYIEMAYSEAVGLKRDRRGTVLLDIPLDMQKMEINENEIKKYDYGCWDDLFPIIIKDNNKIRKEKSEIVSEDICNKILEAKSPVILAGTGIRLSEGKKEFDKLIRRLSVPILFSWNAYDLMGYDEYWNFGKMGTIGEKSSNIIIQNSDLLIILGCRCSIRDIGYGYKDFAKNAYKIMIDIDMNEINKKTLNIDYKIQRDAKKFCRDMNKYLNNKNIIAHLPKQDWIDWCREIRNKYPLLQQKHIDDKDLNPYYFYSVLSDCLDKDAIVVTGNGSASVLGSQCYRSKIGQRFYSSGFGSMAYGLPAAIGAFIGSGKQIVCYEGDGSLNMCVHELAVVKHLNANIKIFVLNNNGYASIRMTQDNYFEGRHIGCDNKDLTFPDWQKIAEAYGLGFSYHKIEEKENLERRIKGILQFNGPALIEVVIDKNYIFENKGIEYDPPEKFKI